jgi:hypothetical protein
MGQLKELEPLPCKTSESGFEYFDVGERGIYSGEYLPGMVLQYHKQYGAEYTGNESMDEEAEGRYRAAAIIVELDNGPSFHKL